jgi:hypothetical protein
MKVKKDCQVIISPLLQSMLGFICMCMYMCK